MKEFVIQLNMHGSDLLTTEEHPGPHPGLIQQMLLEKEDVISALVKCMRFQVDIHLKLFAQDLCRATSRAWQLAGEVTGSMQWTEVVTSVNSLALVA
jgi:hypothetical protein